jgi:hypothetical protein
MAARPISTFDRIALEASIREHPADRTAQGAYLDALMEAGFTDMGARRRVAQVVREATEEAQRVQVAAYIKAWGDGPAYCRRTVNQAAGMSYDQTRYIEVVRGGQPPVFMPGMLWWTDRQKRVYTSLDDYTGDLDDLIRHEQPDRITVGAAWVRRACEDMVTYYGGW